MFGFFGRVGGRWGLGRMGGGGFCSDVGESRGNIGKDPDNGIPGFPGSLKSSVR